MTGEEITLAVARAEAAPGFATLEYNMARFVRILRHLGVRVSQAETLDALAALAGIDLLDAGRVRAALRACLAKSRREAGVFDAAFALFFAGSEAQKERRRRRRELEEREQRRRQAAGRELKDMAGDWQGKLQVTDEQLRTFALLPNAEKERLRAIFGQVKANGVNDAGALINMVLQSSLNYWRYFMMKSPIDRGEDLGEAELTGDPDLDEVIRGVGARFYRHPADRVMYSDMKGLADADLPRVAALIDRLAARLGRAVGRRYRRSSRAVVVDIRRTMRRNVKYGGVPLELRYRARRPKRPRFLLVCDVSASMARYARFVLQFIYGLGGHRRDIETFVFAEDLERVTGCFERDFARGMADLMNGSKEWGKATNLYESLRTFRRLHWDTLGPDSVVFVVSDTKTAAPRAAAGLLGEIRRRCAEVIWLNTLPKKEWADQPTVGLFAAVADMYECNTLAQLAQSLRRHLYRRR